MNSESGLRGRNVSAFAAAVMVVAATVVVAWSSGALRARHCDVPALTGSIVHVTALDLGHMHGGMMSGYAGAARLEVSPHTVPAGAVSFVVTNVGDRTHEVVVLPLATSATVGSRAIGPDARISEAGSRGEASRTCAEGADGGIPPGTKGWVTLHLPAGRYELVCNEPGHYDQGMYAELDVT